MGTKEAFLKVEAKLAEFVRAASAVREVLTSDEYVERLQHARYLRHIEREREIGRAYVKAEAARVREELGLW